MREAVRLDAVVTIVDVSDIADARAPSTIRSGRRRFRPPISSASQNLVHTTHHSSTRLAAHNKALVFDASEPGAFDLLVAQANERTALADRPRVTADRFVSLDWEWTGSVGAERFQACIGSPLRRPRSRQGHRQPCRPRRQLQLQPRRPPCDNGATRSTAWDCPPRANRRAWSPRRRGGARRPA